MADKKISDFTEATSIGLTDWVEVETAAGNSRKVKFQNLVKSGFSGARVRKSVALTGQNLTAGAAVTWDAEDFDTDSYHDTGSNTDRLTVPAAGYYEVTGQLSLANVASANFVVLSLQRLNSSAVLQESVAVQATELSVTGTFNWCANSGPVHFNTGDFARLVATVESDTSTDIGTSSFLAIHRLSVD